MSENTKEIVAKWGDTLTMEQVDEVIQRGSISLLTTAQRSSFLFRYAEKLGLNPLTKPFDLIATQDGKLIVYANRTATDQLRRIHNINSEVVYAGALQLGDKIRDDVYMIRVRLSMPITGEERRIQEAVGCVGITDLQGEALSNAIMKCHTKADRRGTLNIVGLGFLDELEVDSMRAETASSSTQKASPPAAPKILDARPLPAAVPPVKV